jgi:hypothetical protein
MSTSTILEMPVRPKPGEIMLYLELHRIENMTPLAALKLAESPGFKPELRYRTWEKDGVQQTGIYALLRYETREFNSALDADYLESELEALATQTTPDISIHFAYCLKGGRKVA